MAIPLIKDDILGEEDLPREQFIKIIGGLAMIIHQNTLDCLILQLCTVLIWHLCIGYKPIHMQMLNIGPVAEDDFPGR